LNTLLFLEMFLFTTKPMVKPFRQRLLSEVLA